MKFFFSEFGSCFGGPTAALSADSVAQPPLVKGRASSQASRLTNWKPALSAISEGGAVSEERRRAVEAKVRSQKKTKERSRSDAGDDFYSYRKKELIAAAAAAANPGFLPTPYLF